MQTLWKFGATGTILRSYWGPRSRTLTQGVTMGFKYLFQVFMVVFGLAGCASTQVVGVLPEGLWHDSLFDYQTARVTDNADTVFKLDESVRKHLASYDRMGYTTEGRLDLLISRLYGPSGIRLSYNSGHTTGASQTWHNQRGDCLSLTILAYAAAKSLGLSAHMQEVRVPVLLDRRDGLDYVNEHVNLFVRNDTEILINGQAIQAGGFIIDFEPQAGSRATGQWLSENAILARYYNNRATEFMAHDDRANAYAYYRAAIRLAPDYAPAFSNLAQLYASQSLLHESEQLLEHAIALDGPSYAPLRGMAQLLQIQGRDEEARHFLTLLAKRQTEDPYYWLGLGLNALHNGHPHDAVQALERAAAITSGFEEIHYNLGLAYWRDGQRDAAQKQLVALRAINNHNQGIAVLSKKLQANTPQSAVF